MNDSNHQYVSFFAGRSLVRLNENSLLRLGIVHPQHRQEILLNINKLRVKSVVQVHMEQIKEENLKAAKEKQQVYSITHFFTLIITIINTSLMSCTKTIQTKCHLWFLDHFGTDTASCSLYYPLQPTNYLRDHYWLLRIFKQSEAGQNRE